MRFLRKQPPPPLSSSLTATLTGHGGAVNAVGFSPDGRLLASAGSDWRVILWDLADPTHPAQRAVLTHPRPDPRERPSIWRAGMIGRSPRFDPGVKAAGFSPDGRLLATGLGEHFANQYGSGSRGTVALWDVTDPALPVRAATLPHAGGGDGHAVAFSPDGQLLATCRTDKTVRLWDVG